MLDDSAFDAREKACVMSGPWDVSSAFFSRFAFREEKGDGNHASWEDRLVTNFPTTSMNLQLVDADSFGLGMVAQ